MAIAPQPLNPLHVLPRFKGPKGQEDMPYLLTPGPLTTSRGVKQAMLADYGARDDEFVVLVAEIRKELLRLAGCDSTYDAVLLQGSGTFAMEAALGAFTPAKKKKTLVVCNGVYGHRAAAILERLGRPFLKLEKGDTEAPSALEVAKAIDADADISHVWLVHCETTSGIINPVEDIARLAKARGRTVMLDAISSFGALNLDLVADNIDVMVSASGNCLEGVPGFSIVIAKREHLMASEGRSHSVVLDLYAQWKAMDVTGQFRFTAPTHALVAFRQALHELESEGGIATRRARYQRNASELITRMRAMGFRTLLNDEDAGPIIQSFVFPRDAKFDFSLFYSNLRVRGFVIYPGALSSRPSFRIGTIGQLDERVIRAFAGAVEEVLIDMDVREFTPVEP